ncbi:MULTISPECIES: helix-turn-helix domain-containing protein [unclassified Brevundimonas]|uniref:helix-turn-helix domain-containing protein n=1 Tax=unclassified Brevundimonas TaxID=2622653 RepID=UPI0006FF5BF6|nr:MULTISPECIES: helix-turn-helix domain-containing protein [unclassified Brevundimonas]KQY66788.1 hypothetical protein ASD25_14735 [Brevundimonas sp. Root1423]KRA22808.1 hypothetical protein ASD59_09255 [Brevundimonas sp. Root608]
MSRLLDVHNFVGDKLRWQTQVLLDVALSASARTVGCLIAHDLNVERGAAWRAQENMAVALGLSLSTIRRGIGELRRAGHLSVRRSRGRGRTQNYVAMILDAAEAHDSIDQAILARKAAVAGEPEKVSPVTLDAAEKVAPVTLDAAEKVAPVTGQASERVSPVNGDVAERVSPVTQKGGASDRQSLEDSITPPFPPSRANRVRSNWGEPLQSSAPFPAREVREAIIGRLGEAGARSWLDPHGWDRESRTIVTNLAIAADKLRSDCGRELRGLDVKVVCDKARHDALRREPRPVFASEGKGLAA